METSKTKCMYINREICFGTCIHYIKFTSAKCTYFLKYLSLLEKYSAILTPPVKIHSTKCCTEIWKERKTNQVSWSHQEKTTLEPRHTGII